MSSGRSRRDDRKRGGGGGRGGRYRYYYIILFAYEFDLVCSCARNVMRLLFIYFIIIFMKIRTLFNDKQVKFNCGDIIGRAINSHSYYCVLLCSFDFFYFNNFTKKTEIDEIIKMFECDLKARKFIFFTCQVFCL